MRELTALFSPQWWTFKNRLFRSGWASYIKGLVILVLAAAFWAAAFHFLTDLLARLQGMEANVGNIIALKGLSLVLMLVFFLLIFSSLLTGINSFYLAQDLPVILSSPLSKGSIYLSRWLETALKSSWMILFAVLPLFLAFGFSFKVSAGYYVSLLPILIFFVLIPAGLGVMAGMLLMAVVPAKRARNIFVMLGILVLVIIFTLFRLLRPERFANPEWFANLTIFLSEMKAPVSPLLPSTWVAEALTPFFGDIQGTPLFYQLLLFFTVAATVVIGSWIFGCLHYRGLVKAQQSQRRRRGTQSDWRLPLLSLFVRQDSRALMEKEISTFSRSVGQWSQMLLLFAVIVIYLFSIKALPIDWGTSASVRLKYIIAFLNIGLVGFVVTAIAARLVVPLVNCEGKSFWIIRVSPMSIRRFLWSKFLFAFLPLLLIALVLIIVSSLFLGITRWFMLMAVLTSAVLTASISGMALGIGAYSAQFSAVDRDREQTGLQGTAFMLSAFALIAVTILLEILPAAGLFMTEAESASFTLRGWIITVLPFLAALVLNGFVLWKVMKVGGRRLSMLE